MVEFQLGIGLDVDDVDGTNLAYQLALELIDKHPETAKKFLADKRNWDDVMFSEDPQLVYLRRDLKRVYDDIGKAQEELTKIT